MKALLDQSAGEQRRDLNAKTDQINKATQAAGGMAPLASPRDDGMAAPAPTAPPPPAEALPPTAIPTFSANRPSTG